MGNVTINGDLTGTAVGGLVGGAANLTTAGAIPYVSSAGVLNQDATALFWDAANNRLGIGTNAPGLTLDVLGNARIDSGSGNAFLYLSGVSRANTGALIFTSAGFSGNYNSTSIDNNTTGSAQANTALGSARLQIGGGALDWGGANALALGYVNAGGTFATPNVLLTVRPSGNLLIGTTTDGNFKLDVATSGSSGTARFYDQTATTGSTRVVVRAGAGQSSANLTTWQNDAGTTLASVTSSGYFSTTAFAGFSVASDGAVFYNPSSVPLLVGSSSFQVRWRSGAAWYDGTADLSLSRASAGVLQVGDGAANANGQINAGSLNAVGVLSAYSSTGGVFISGDPGQQYKRIQAYSDVNGTSTHLSLNAAGSNVLIGTTVTDGFRLDVATSAGSGTFRVYDRTPTTGVTRAVIRAGAGQSTTNLQEWQNSSGTVQSAITGSGDIFGQAYLVGNNGRIDFSNGTAYVQAIRRRSDSIIAFDNSTAIGTTPGNARDIMVRGVYAAETTSDPSAADLTIAGSNAQDTFRLYMKNDKLVVAYQVSGTVNYLTIPLDGATTTWTQSTTAP